MAEKENKRYFVKDEALRNTDNDMFSYGDMAEVFKKIIDTTKPPYNVAVIGKWGLGKSSLIRLVTEECKKKGEEYLVQEINAWKYERESLRKVFLKQLWQELSEQKIKSFEIIRKEYERIIYDDFDELNKEPKKR